MGAACGGPGGRQSHSETTHLMPRYSRPAAVPPPAPCKTPLCATKASAQVLGRCRQQLGSRGTEMERGRSSVVHACNRDGRPPSFPRLPGGGSQGHQASQSVSQSAPCPASATPVVSQPTMYAFPCAARAALETHQLEILKLNSADLCLPAGNARGQRKLLRSRCH